MMNVAKLVQHLLLHVTSLLNLLRLINGREHSNSMQAC